MSSDFQRLMGIIHQMREIITQERGLNARLREENVRLKQACQRHGLDIERILA